MKGRARQDNASFFVFQSRDEDEKSLILSLADAQATERRLRRFLSTHSPTPKHYQPLATQESRFDGSESGTLLDEEILAVRKGFYVAR